MIAFAVRRAAPLVACLLLAACPEFNNITEIRPYDWSTPAPTRAVIIYGIGLEAPWPYQGFAVNLGEYDAVRGAIRGDCWRYNHTRAVVMPATVGALKYFAFSAEPGYFAQSPSTSYPLEGMGEVAFHAPAGRITYIGEFTYQGKKPMALRRDLDRARAAVRMFPTLDGEPVFAETVPIEPQYMWLCTP